MKQLYAIVMVMAVLAVISCTPQQPQAELPPLPLADEESSAPSAPKGDSTQVVIESFSFMPTNIDIAVGDTIEWVNKDSVSHTVTFDDGSVDVELPIGATAQHTFTEAGSFSYLCSFHPQMQGVVVVR